jgi:fructose 1,6-bisphosphatase
MGFEMTEIAFSLMKADVGGYPGHSSVHPALMEICRYPGRRG